MLHNIHDNRAVPARNDRIPAMTQFIILSGIAFAMIALLLHMLLTRTYITSGIPLLGLAIAWMTLFR